MKTKSLHAGTTGPGSVAGRSTLTRTCVLLPLVMLLVLPSQAKAQFNYTVDNGTITITGYTGPGGHVFIPETIEGLPVTGIGYYAFNYRQDLTSIFIPESVTSIGESAFGFCAGLTSITIPNSVTSIGAMAWYGCSKLSSVGIPSSVMSIGRQAFGECTNLTAIIVDALNPNYSSADGVLFNKNQSTLIQCPPRKSGSYAIPGSVNHIEADAFSLCARLTSVEIPDSVKIIPYEAFYACSGLTSMTIPDSVTSIEDFAFWYCTGLVEVTVGNSVTNIGWEAFGDCPSLTTVSLGENVNSIGFAAFSDCTSLTEIWIPASVARFEIEPFMGSTNLTAITVDALNPIYSSLDGVLFNRDRTALIICPEGRTGSYTIPDSVTSIGYDSVTSIEQSGFSRCTRLTEVRIPASVTSIGQSRFGQCTSLNAITVDALNPVYSSLDGVLFNSDQTTLIRCPEGRAGSYTIPGSVLSIASGAFRSCIRLTGVVIPDSVASIGSYAFEYCRGLTMVTLGNGVTSIGNSAFVSCTGLGSVTMGKSVTSIGGRAFEGCTSLTAVYFEGDAPRLVGQWTFTFRGTSATIYYLPGTSGWGASFGGRPTALWGVEPVPFTYIVDNGTVTITGYTGPGGAVVIPETLNGLPVTSIGPSAFYGNSDVTSIAIPDSVTRIGDEAFSWSLAVIEVDAGNLFYGSVDGVLLTKDQTTLIHFPGGKAGDYTVPDGVVRIADFAFQGCANLISVTISDGVTSIGAWAFDGCRGLTSIAIPNSVTTISHRAFIDCTSLTSVTIPNSVTRISDATFYNCTGLTSVAIPASVTSIGADAFGNCSSLTSVAIPNGVTSIELGAFLNCTSLTVVTIPHSVTSIPSYAFAWCTSLSSITIPNSVTSIEESAFEDCTSLTAVYVEGDAPGVLGQRVFEGTSATIYYLPGTSGWGATFGGRPTMPWSVIWGDVDGDDDVDRNDLAMVVAARNTIALGSEDPRDLDGDGRITVLDARILVTLFTRPGGAIQ